MNISLRNLALLLAVFCTFGVSQATAATLEMQLLDMDLFYNADAAETGALYDIKGFSGGNREPNESDELQAAQIKVDGVLAAGSPLTNTMYGDFLRTDVQIPGTTNSLTSVGAADNSFGFEWFDDEGNFLKLNFDELDVVLTDTVLFVTGQASSLAGQQLPGGLAGFDANQPILISYSATLPAIVGTNPIETITASGAMTISGTQIPEPTTVGLMAVAMGLALAAVRRR